MVNNMILINSILIVIFLFCILKLFTKIGYKILFLTYILLNFIQQIASIIYLNTGVFVNELNRTTYYVSESIPLFIFYTDIFFIALCFFAKKSNKYSKNTFSIKKSEGLSKWYCYGILLITAMFTMYTFADLCVSGIPMFNDFITHWNYYSVYSTLPYASTVNNLISVAMFLLGFAFVHNNNIYFKKTCIVIMMISVILRILMGFRMSGLIDIPMNFYAIVVLSSPIEFKNIRQAFKIKYILITIFVVSSVVGIFIMSTFMNTNSSDIEMIIDLLVNRALGLGNHLWWAAEADELTGNGIIGHNLLNEILLIITFGDQFDVNTGMYYLMNKYGNSYIVNVDIDHGIRFAATFITTTVYNWGYILSFIPIIIVAKITIWFIYSMEDALISDNFFQLALLCKIWVTFVTFVVASGTIAEWLNIENYLYFLLYLIIKNTIKSSKITIK